MSYIIAILALAALCAVWVLVQRVSGVPYRGTGCAQCECGGEDKVDGDRTCKRELAIVDGKDEDV